MFTHYYTRGVVLAKKPIGECDEIVTLYTRDFGMVKVVGKSIRKSNSKLKMGVPLFSYTEVGFIQGKSYNTLIDATLISNFKNAKTDIGKTSLFYRLSEIILSLIQGEERDENVFFFILDSFEKVDKLDLSRKKMKVFYYLFSLRFLYLLGHKINIEECVFCGKKVKKRCYFNPREGEVCCRECLRGKSEGVYLENTWLLQKLMRKKNYEAN